jgi:hypothetical protein
MRNAALCGIGNVVRANDERTFCSTRAVLISLVAVGKEAEVEAFLGLSVVGS